MACKIHWQFLGLVLAVLGLILTAGVSGVNDWRVWFVDDLSIINSGVAWVGIWRACFYSHVLDTVEFCRSFSITDSFIPLEIAVAQVLCVAALLVGMAGNLVAGYAMKRAYFNINPGQIRWAFTLAGVLYLLTATCSLVPVIWNMNSVLFNHTIDFPPEFHLPPAPYKQALGTGIIIGIGSSLLLIFSGLLFLLYRQPVKHQKANPEAVCTEERDTDNTNSRITDFLNAITENGEEGTENPAFKAEDTL